MSQLPSRSFGVGLWTGQRPRDRRGRHFSDAVTLAQAAEVAGFDVFWVPEHHGWNDGFVPSPLALLAALTPATTTIRLGTGLAVAPLHHPLRLASDAVVVDHLSGGRLILGLGIGYAENEYRMFGVDRQQRGRMLEETVHILRHAWTGEPFSWPGPAFPLTDVRVTPAALGSIPIWLGGYAPAAVRRAARLADGHLVGRGAPEILASTMSTLRSEGGPGRAGFTLAVNVAAVLDAPGGHSESAREAFARQQGAYEAIQRERSPYGGLVSSPAETAAGQPARPVEEYLQAGGDADAVVAAVGGILDTLAGWPSVHIALRILFPEPDVGAQVERLAAFGSLVLPRLRAWASGCDC